MKKEQKDCLSKKAKEKASRKALRREDPGIVLYPTYYSDKVKGKTVKESGVINEKNIAI